jgi:SAM-dependent MidA family methyltransferase
MDLTGIIIERIQNEGPISFHDFMEMALYYPGLGYYTSAGSKFGRQGDYFTSPHLSPVIGMVVGKQIEEMWRHSGEENFTIVEYGAGEGFLCHDILDYLQPANRLRYCIIEKSPAMREKQAAHLQGKVEWYDSMEAIGDVTGCVLSNELVDNFAVHRVVMQEQLKEVYLDYQNGFVEVLRPAGHPLTNYLEELGVQLTQGFQTEINLDAIQWIKDIGAALKKGYVITIDYGYPAAELYRSSRRTGTLLCYHQHQINDNPYTAIGMQDITAHVNFSALCHWGFKNGLACAGLVSQAAFLLALDFKDCFRKILAAEEDKRKAVLQEAMLTRTFLLDMGMRLKVLIQHKGMAGKKLSGLQVPGDQQPFNLPALHTSVPVRG